MNLPTRTTRSRRTRSVAMTATLALVVGLITSTATGPARADSDPADPSNPATPTTVTADALPTVQIDGVVWSQAIAGDRVYAGGNFDTARPAGANPGTNEVTRNNLLAYDLQSGDLISSFSPNVNGQITAVAVSPDESRIYVGGNFTTIDGQSRRRIAAFNANNGTLISNFAPRLTGSADAIVATNTTVYAGGSFLGVGNQDRSNLAAFRASDGALLNWAPQTVGGTVRALAIKPDGSKVVVGGSFTSLNGDAQPGYGLGMVDAVTGQNEPFEINDIIRNGTDNGAITTLDADGDYVYGGGYTFGKSGGTFEGVFAADWDGGDVHWVNDCHGDTYSVHPQGDVVYQAGHFHYCENIDGFRQGDGFVGSYPYNRGTAMSKAATGTATWEPDQGRYYSFEGQPAPSQLTWFPSLNAGQATGQFQGPWNVDGTDDYIVMGGEFTRVNGDGQQGLVRYAMKEDAPNDRGPQLGGSSFPIKARSDESGQVRINWPSNYDDDNSDLTYRLYRDDQNAGGQIHTRQFSVPYWFQPTMGFTDTGLTPGSSHRYRVSATDPAGNVANSPWIEVTVANSGTVSAYESAVRNSEPTHYWRLGEASGTTVEDTVGWAPMTARAGISRGVGGAVAGDSDTASRFNGGSTGFASTNATANPPDVFTLEAWFKTSSVTGGKIVGWGNRNDRNSSKNDRHLYVDSSGRVHFGVKPNASRQVVTSGGGLNNGQWHQATATLGDNGMKLYIDGSLVDQNAAVTVGEHLSRGYWRIGGDTLSSWPSAPVSGFFNGDIDEVAQYDRVLTPSAIQAHYAAATGAPTPNVDPVARFTSNVDGLQVSVDGLGSTDSDGTIASYAWDFGDSGTGTGASPSHTYSSAGTYDVELTVTDDDGGTDTVTHQVTVSEPPANVDPVAAFTSGVTGLQVSVDGSGSTDSDGTIASYAWDFGDSGTGTGVSPSHTYATAGTYTVELTVTDNDGATDTITHDVTVDETPTPQVIAQDAFERATTNGLGAADIGGPWTRTGSAGSYSVSAGVGHIRTNGAQGGKSAYLGGTASTSTDMLLDIALDKAPTGGSAYLSATGRRIDDANKYNATLRYFADGSATLSLRRILGDAETVLQSVNLPGTVTATDTVRVRVQVEGTSPTQLRAKAWEVGSSEPTGWQVSASDNAVALQHAGAVGTVMYIGTVTNAPITLDVDNLDAQSVTDAQPPANNPPVARRVEAVTQVNTAVTTPFRAGDPDGGAVSIAVANPDDGKAVVRNGKLRYTPDRRFVGKDRFRYTARGERGSEDSARVVVRVRKTKADIRRIRVRPADLVPSDRPRISARVRARRTRVRGKFVIRTGGRRVGAGRLGRDGGLSTRIKRLGRGMHRLRITYLGSATVRRTSEAVRVRVG